MNYTNKKPRRNYKMEAKLYFSRYQQGIEYFKSGKTWGYLDNRGKFHYLTEAELRQAKLDWKENNGSEEYWKNQNNISDILNNWKVNAKTKEYYINHLSSKDLRKVTFDKRLIKSVLNERTYNKYFKYETNKKTMLKNLNKKVVKRQLEKLQMEDVLWKATKKRKPKKSEND